MQIDLEVVKKELDTLKKENEKLKVEAHSLNKENELLRRENTLLKNYAEEKEKTTNSVLSENESLALKLKGSGEWEKIAQTISHTMKGPNNNIVNKLNELDTKLTNPTDEIKSLMTIIESEARYSNDIIGLFDIIRKGDIFTTEAITLSDIINIIRNSEKRCISLAWYGGAELSKYTLDRLKGEVISNSLRFQDQEFLNLKYSENLNLGKSYIVNKTALTTVVDEFILNMFRYAMSHIKPEPYHPCKEKPKFFEIAFFRKRNDLKQYVIDIIFRNSSRDPIYKAFREIHSEDKNISLTKKSFGLYLASLFSGIDYSFSNIKFYDLSVPEHEDYSEITLTLRESA